MNWRKVAAVALRIGGAALPAPAAKMAERAADMIEKPKGCGAPEEIEKPKEREGGP